MKETKGLPFIKTMNRRLTPISWEQLRMIELFAGHSLHCFGRHRDDDGKGEWTVFGYILPNYCIKIN